MKNQKLFLMIILASFLFPEEFEINENSSESLSSITFSIGDISFENKDGYLLPTFFNTIINNNPPCKKHY